MYTAYSLYMYMYTVTYSTMYMCMYMYNRKWKSMHTHTHTLNSTHFSTPLEVGQPLLEDNETESEQSHNETVTSITKHHSK